MQEALDTYLAIIDQQPSCDESWFSDALTRSRLGDDDARRRILASYLRLAWECARSSSDAQPSHPLFDLIQEANAGLEEGLAAFSGQTLVEFEACLRLHVQVRLGKWING